MLLVEAISILFWWSHRLGSFSEYHNDHWEVWKNGYWTNYCTGSLGFQGSNRMDWHAWSPDMNYVEHILGAMSKQLSAQEDSVEALEQLEEAVKQIWTTRNSFWINWSRIYLIDVLFLIRLFFVLTTRRFYLCYYYYIHSIINKFHVSADFQK